MKKLFITSFKMLGVMVLLLGVVYPFLVTLFAQVLFPAKANGSLIKVEGRIVGSEWIGQQIDTAIYFHSRPSAVNYNSLSSGGSNLGLTNQKLHQLVEERKIAFKRTNHLQPGTTIPSEMLFASGSGLDPHISPQAARLQVDRISQARGFSESQRRQLDRLVHQMTEAPQWGVLGCERINVLMLNLALDRIE